MGVAHKYRTDGSNSIGTRFNGTTGQRFFELGAYFVNVSNGHRIKELIQGSNLAYVSLPSGYNACNAEGNYNKMKRMISKRNASITWSVRTFASNSIDYIVLKCETAYALGAGLGFTKSVYVPDVAYEDYLSLNSSSSKIKTLTQFALDYPEDVKWL